VGDGDGAVLIRPPGERGARELLRDALSALGEAVEFNDDEEASAWWAAYAGLEFRPRAQTADEALHAALRQEVGRLDTPPSLPPEPRRRELADAIAWLPGVAH
jgi:hypothetical protein